MAKSRFLLVLALMSVFAVAVPFDAKLTPLLIAARTSGARISVTGNSVLEHTSKCDRDSRSLASMLADEIHQPVLNLGFSGQALSTAVNLAGVSLQDPHVHTVIFPVSLFALYGWDTEPIRSYALFRLLNPELKAASLAERVRSPGRFSGAEDSLEAGFDYGGRSYPDYRGIKAIYLSREKVSMGCPEGDGADLRFVTANYYHNLFELPVDPRALALVQDLGQAAKRRGKPLLVVILPIDYELVTQLGLPGDALRRKVGLVAETFSQAGLDVLDLSTSLRNDDFADRWCACGHLLESGRRTAVEAIGNRLRGHAQELASHYQ